MATRSWNRVELIGNLTRDPELRYTPTGAAVCTFSIATNRTYVSDGEKKEEADFHRVVAWNKLAELCSQLLKKGNRIFISGRLQNRSWEAQDGQQKQLTEIVAEDMLILTSKNDSISGGSYDSGELPTRVEPATPKPQPKVEVPVEDTSLTEDITPPTASKAPAEVADLNDDDLPF